MEPERQRAADFHVPSNRATPGALFVRYSDRLAQLRNLQSDKQTIHPRDLPPQKREALIGEIFEILKDPRR